jgi:L-amino acid N-acyltransferase YncA
LLRSRRKVLPHSSGPAGKLEIRSATPADWPQLWPIVSAVAASGASYTISPDISESDARAYWMAPGVHTFVAERDGRVVGTYVIKANQPGLGSHVANAGYMVAPGNDGQGIGASMAEHSFEAARELGFLAMQYNAVVSTNTRAVALWQRLGFTIIGTVPRAYRLHDREFVDLHLMHRFL